MANIRDVGKLAGVSVATVSRVINEKGYVNKETKEKILKAMEMLNYKPSDIARRLAGMKSKTIGLIIPDILNPFFPTLARAVEDALNKVGYSLILCNTDNNHKKEKEYFEMLINKQVDGIIISSYSISPAYLEEIKEKGMPLVVIDNEFEGYDIPNIWSDNFEGGKIATQHLIDCGCTQIAHIAGDLNIKSMNERYKGYSKICEENEQINSRVVNVEEFTLKEGYEATTRLMKKNKNIDGIFVATDTLAIGAYKALKDLGYKIPRDVKLIGYDGIKANIDYLEISSVEQPIYEYGKLSVEILLKKIAGDLESIDKFKLPISLAKRNSTIGR